MSLPRRLCTVLFLPAVSALLGSLACRANRAVADGGMDAAGVIEPGSDDAAVACPSGGWCWEHGDDATDAGLPAPARLTGSWSSGPRDRWVVSTAGTVLRNVGAGWVPVDVGSQLAFNGIWGTGPDDVWIVGAAGTILHKDGSGWSRVVVPTTQTLNAIWGSGRDNFWIVGDGGTILHRDGASWFTVNGGTTVSLRGGWGSGNNDVWAVGDGGTILHWDGTSGSRSSSGTSVGLLAAGGTGPTDAWAVGRQGMILHWNGTNWSPFASNTLTEPTPGLATLQSVWARRRDDAWALGAAGVVVHWNGVRWAQDSTGTTRDLFAVRTEADQTVWAAGDREAILRRGPLVSGDGGAPNGGNSPAFEPPPTDCHPTLVLRLFSADATNIENVAAVVVRIEEPGSSTMYTLTNVSSTIYADRSTGVSFCTSLHGTHTFMVELRSFDGCLLGTATTTAYVLDDVTAIDLVFPARGCLPDGGVDATAADDAAATP